MSEDLLLSSLTRITAGEMSLMDAIDAASQLRDAGQAASAEQLYRVWIKFNADHPHLYAAWFNLSTVPGLEPAAVIAALEQALKLNPSFWPGHINLGGCYERGGDAGRAIGQWQQVTGGLEAINGSAVNHKLTALKQICRVLLDKQQSEPAEAFLQQCLEINPRQRDALEQYFGVRLSRLSWPVVQPWDGVDRKILMEGVSPLSLACYTDDPLLQLAAAARYVDLTSGADAGDGRFDRRDAPTDVAGRPIRVGYVSSDLRDHAVGFLMAGVFAAHDPARVETYAYYCGPPLGGDLYERFKRSAAQWREITNLSDDEAAALIAADQIDILVDVNGHTRFARTAVFARRPAPIQVNWLGFPGTMGSSFHQYLIADPRIIRPEDEIYYSEKVLRLPCYQPNDPNRVVAERPSRAEAGLPEDAFVYCCFNGAQKIDRFTFSRWMEILRRTPGSVLWLLANDDAVNERMRGYAVAAGVAPERLVFAQKLANPYHLARYPLADLFLDTMPYGAHTTASDALWMGVPMLTLAGRGFASRVCASLVSAAGQPDMICATASEYVERAVGYASDPAAIAELKRRLEATRATCELFDLAGLVRELERLYAEMCATHQAGATPRPDLHNLELYFKAGLEHDPDAAEMHAEGDYHGLWRQRLARLHRHRPIAPDARLWTPDDAAWFDPAAAHGAEGTAPRVRVQSSTRKRTMGAATA